MPPTITVILPTFYRYKYLADVLNMLARQTRMADEIIVADQTPPADRPEGFYKQFSPELKMTVIDIEKPSLTAPRNLAARKSKGDILLFLDDDIVVADDFVQMHLEVMEKEHVDVVNGATTLDDKLPEEYPWDVTVLDPVRFFLAAPNYKWEGMMLSISSCNVSIKKDLFFAVGGFDEKLPRMVDFELGYRLFRHGAKIFFSYKPAAKHLRGEGGSRKNPKNHNKLLAALYIHKKHFPGWITRQFIYKNIVRKRVLIEPWLPFVVILTSYKAGRLLNSKRN